jgi:hypothetical protein
MRSRWGIDVARGVLIAGWLLLAIRMKTSIGWPELVAGGVLIGGTVIVFAWD